MRFLDAIEYYGIRIIFRSGKLNVMADYLSRPESDGSETAFPALVEEREGDDLQAPDTVEDVWELNRMDLQAIAEHLSQGAELPNRIDGNWARMHFTWHNNKLQRIITYKRIPGDPPHPEGIATASTILLETLDYDQLVAKARKIHQSQGHATIGNTVRHISY